MLVTSVNSFLLVEDNADDAELLRRAFAKTGICNPLVHVTDGVWALDYLFARGSYLDRGCALPAVVLLDLKLPRLDGIEVLKAIRASEMTRLVPVVVLTSSDEPSELAASYRHRANSYVTKPVDFLEYLTVARELGRYWGAFNMTIAAALVRT